MTAQPKLGVCYYPEHWPEAMWADDARAMRKLGIEQVRIGEFAWSRIEPEAGRFVWDWLDQAIETLATAGLQIVMGTPTATPPKWLVDAHPDILPLDKHGNPRRFGSRRHYCFSSKTYLREAERIVTELARRYGDNPAIVGWQLDNEYGCHDTSAGLSADALTAFRLWLKNRYKKVHKLNEAWGAVFWSQEYGSFDEIDLPFATVTEANPDQRLDHWRFSSDQVAAFNKQQVDILRTNSTGRWLTHNFMGNFADFDHYKVGCDLTIASWDSYPLGHLETGWFDEETKNTYRTTGHPDWAAFHHDLCRGIGSGRFGVMEQQPGPVNWAPWNAMPAPGMVRLWSWEAIAHGAEFVSYFRWRQAPFAQEQMHAGLRHADNSPAVASDEVAQLHKELQQIELSESTSAEVAILFDYEACATTDIQSSDSDFSQLGYAFDFYRAMRKLGLDIDIIPVDSSLDGYRLVVVPGLPIISADMVSKLADADAQILLGARSGSKTINFWVPPKLPPGLLQELIDIQVTEVESLRPGCEVKVTIAGNYAGHVKHWRESVRTEIQPEAKYEDQSGFWYRNGHRHYLSGRADEALLNTVLESLCDEAGISTWPVNNGLRYRRRGNLCFAFNYGPDNVQFERPPGEILLDGPELKPGKIAAWRIDE